MTAEQMLAAVAVTLATKAAEGLAEGGRAAFAALVRLVRRRFEGRGSARKALADAEADPADSTRIESLREVLKQAVAQDPAFATELQRLWQDLSPHLVAIDGGVVNNLSGSVRGNVVQARDVHGGISFGDAGQRSPDSSL